MSPMHDNSNIKSNQRFLTFNGLALKTKNFLATSHTGYRPFAELWNLEYLDHWSPWLDQGLLFTPLSTDINSQGAA
jgi:hypothetical protein